MSLPDREEEELRSVALQNAASILVARQRAERELIAAKEALEQKTVELARSVARMRATLESTTDAIVVTDREGVLSDYNANFLQMWRIPAETMAAGNRREIREMLMAQVTDPALFLVRIDEIRATVPMETFDTIELADGRVIERNSRLQLDAGLNVGRVWSFRDITSHRKAAAELREQREWFRVTLSSIGDAVITTDLEAKVTFLNPVAEQMTGWPDDEARGHPLESVFHIIHEETRAATANPIMAVLRDGVTVALANHTALVSRDGREIAIEDSAAPIRDAAGKVAGAVMVFHDVTARRRVEDALRRSEARVRIALETAALGTWELDLKSDTVTLDERCQELFETGGRSTLSFTDFVGIARFEDRAGRREALGALVSGEKDRFEIEFCLGAGERWIRASAKPVRDRDGAVMRVVGAVLEITDLIKARTTMEERRHELQRLVDERTASLQQAIGQMEEFSYSVSHDLRAPLRSIQIYAQTVLEDFGERIGAEGSEYLRRILNAGSRMDRLTRDVLTYSKLARGTIALVSVSLDRVVKETIELYATVELPAGAVTIREPLLPVMGHEALLVQALSNLLGNAVKFVARGAAPRIHVRTEPHGADVRLWVEDNGIGIRPEHQHRIWGMFERVHPKDKYEGTGIGLAIVRKAVERMGGTVGVESDGEHGSRFWIQLRAG